MLTKIRAVCVVVLGGLLTAGSIFAASSAVAAPYTRQPTLSVSTQTPVAGGHLTVTGTGFVNGTPVTVTLHSAVVTLGSATPDASGNFSLSVTLPSNVTGTHTIVASGPAANDTASVTITIGTGSGTGGPTSGSGGGLSATGVAVISIGSVGVLLLGAGGLMLLFGRRRKLVA